MNGHNSRNSIKKFAWMALAASLIFPVICLDYIFTEPNLGQFTVPHGQYIFFGTTLLSACILFFKLRNSGLQLIFRNKKLWIFVTLFVIGFTISSPSVWGARLLSIITLASISMIIIVCFVHENETKLTPFVVFFLLAPFTFLFICHSFLNFSAPSNLGCRFRILNMWNILRHAGIFYIPQQTGLGLMPL